jgi:16S rRNA (cytosine1402-N4)-methyltransferase
MHKPVLLSEVVAMSKGEAEPSLIWDGTFGRGGHTKALLETYPNAVIYGTDRDAQALDFGREHFAAEIASGRLRLTPFNFHNFQTGDNTELMKDGFDLVLLDLGVSSPQLDDPQRGFSFYQSGPLDMRMDPSSGISAADIVNTWTEVGLQRLFIELGEIHRPMRVVKAILEARKEKPFSTTGELSSLIERVEGWRIKGRHPATQFFLALRLLVNDELDGLKNCLPLIMEKALRPGGRLEVITFHSLEDRIVKTIFRGRKDLGCPVNKKVIPPSRPEILENPRARSAKLRVFQRGSNKRDAQRSEGAIDEAGLDRH